MNENLIIALITMFVSGITFVAYKHPRLYLYQFFTILLVISFLIAIVPILYNTVVINTYAEFHEFFSSEHREAASQRKDELKISGNLTIGGFALLCFSFFLAWLSDHMMRSSGDIKRRGDQNAAESDDN